jgi:hypothetical protein
LQAPTEQVNLHAMPAQKPSMRRDTLGQFCFWLHIAFLLFIVAGWAIPLRAALVVYMVFLPLLVLHWKLNRDACILNNLENWLRHRVWRAPERNPEEGAWLRTLIQSLTGIALTRLQMDLISYAALAIFWGLAWWRFAHFQGA